MARRTTPPKSKRTSSAGGRKVRLVLSSEGQRLLRELDVPGSEVAKAIGSTKATVSAWMTGRKRPSANMQRALAKAFGIPVPSWSARPGPVSVAPPPAPGTAPASTRATRVEILDALIEDVRRQWQRPDLAVPERLKYSELLRRLVEQRELGEEDDESTLEDRYWRSAAGRALRQRLVEALKPFPDAARAVVEALGGAAA